MASVIDELVTLLSFKVPLESKSNAAKFNTSIKDIAKSGTLAAIALTATAAAIFKFETNSSNAAESISQLAMSFGVSTTNLQDLILGSKKFIVSSDEIISTLKNLQSMGFSHPIRELLRLGAAFKGLSATRAALLNKQFQLPTGLVTLFRKSGSKDLIAQMKLVEKTGAVMSTSLINQLKKVHDGNVTLGRSFSSLSNHILRDTLPAFFRLQNEMIQHVASINTSLIPALERAIQKYKHYDNVILKNTGISTSGIAKNLLLGASFIAIAGGVLKVVKSFVKMTGAIEIFKLLKIAVVDLIPSFAILAVESLAAFLPIDVAIIAVAALGAALVVIVTHLGAVGNAVKKVFSDIGKVSSEIGHTVEHLFGGGSHDHTFRKISMIPLHGMRADVPASVINSVHGSSNNSTMSINQNIHGSDGKRMGNKAVRAIQSSSGSRNALASGFNAPTRT